MKNKTKKARPLIIVAIALLMVIPVVGKTTPTDVLQTIPPITISSRNAIAGCTLLDTTPGSVIAGTSGVILASCNNGYPAIILAGSLLSQVILNTTAETPTFLLTTGWFAIGLAYHGVSCNPGVKTISPINHQLVKQNITSGMPVTFSNQVSNMTLSAGSYDYCLFYANPPMTGILTFTVSWSP